jgi:hypothetical protein
MDMADPIRAENWLAGLGTRRGHELSGLRPVVPAVVVADWPYWPSLEMFEFGLASH